MCKENDGVSPVRLKGVCSAIGKVDNKGRAKIQIYEHGYGAIGT